MLVNLVTVEGDVVPLDLPVGVSYADLQAVVESEFGVPVKSQQIYKDGKALSPHNFSLLDNDVLYIAAQAQPFKGQQDVSWRDRVDDALKTAHINANMAAALEHHPEAFAPVCMVYVRMTVNGHALAGFVDSGAQSTIISQQCAMDCGIGHLIDKRFNGIAKGVGTGKILGKIHAVVVSVGRQHLSCALTVIEGSIGPDLIFGLDMLKRHQVCAVEGLITVGCRGLCRQRHAHPRRARGLSPRTRNTKDA
jgi:hypothetical protein